MGCPEFLPAKNSESREQSPRKAWLLGKPARDSAWRAPLAGWKRGLISWISGLRGLSDCFAAAAAACALWDSQIWKRANLDKSRAETLPSLHHSFMLLPACKSSPLGSGWKGIFPSEEILPFSDLPGKQQGISSLYSRRRKSQTKQSCSVWRSPFVSLERKSIGFFGFQPLWRTNTLWTHFPASWMSILSRRLLVNGGLCFPSLVDSCSFLSLPCRRLKLNCFFLQDTLNHAHCLFQYYFDKGRGESSRNTWIWAGSQSIDLFLYWELSDIVSEKNVYSRHFSLALLLHSCNLLPTFGIISCAHWTLCVFDPPFIGCTLGLTGHIFK